MASMAVSGPVWAELLPKPEEIALPGERALLSGAFLQLLGSQGTDLAKVAVSLEELLGKLRQPTKLRGYVQFLRASALHDLDKDRDAREAVDESIRLLPGYSGPLLLASSIYAYNDEPGRGADYLLRASEIDPDIVSSVPEYEINNIFHRLTFQQDQRRVRLLSERLLEIGWVAESLSQRSALARRAIEARMAKGSIAGAKALVPKLLSPIDSRTLLIENKYKQLWPEIETWAGPQLRNQWQMYLKEVRSKWEASKDPSAAVDYVRALDQAGHDATIIREILPVFSASLHKTEDYDFLFVVPSIAGALSRKGRWSDIEAMFEAASIAWPLGEHANALNVAGNRARYLLYSGRTQEALKAIDAVIADTERWGGQVNADAIATMHHYRACMLHALGDEQEAIISAAIASSGMGPVSKVNLFLCLNKIGEAQKTLMLALEKDEIVDDVLSYLQKSETPPMQSEYGRLMNARHQALRSDPGILNAAAKRGRVLPFSLQSGAPAEMEPAVSL